MIKKRFTFYYERGNEVVIEENGKRISNKKVVDLLNEQQTTIQQQSKRIQELLLSARQNDELFEEQNKTIKRQSEQIKKLSDLLFIERTNNAFDRTEISKRNIELVEENEQLRKQVAEYEMILRQHEFAEKEGFK